jgi:hypothetical protein
MELIKQSEQYKVTDTLENGWVVNGTVTNGTDLNLWVSVGQELGEMVGNISYTKPAQGNVSMHYDVAEDTRGEFAEYANTLVDYVLEYFKQ